MRLVKSFDDVNSILKDLNDKLDLLRTRDIDMKGRRVVNMSPSQNADDAVTRKELAIYSDNDAKLQARLDDAEIKINTIRQDLDEAIRRIEDLETP